MTEKQKEINEIYRRYARQGYEATKNMTIEEEKKYIDETEPKMKKELQEVEKKYSTK